MGDWVIQSPPGYEPARPPIFRGGSETDHADLMTLYYRFRLINR
jgi:hypothetical protein